MPSSQSTFTDCSTSGPHHICAVGKKIISTLQMHQVEFTEATANSKAAGVCDQARQLWGTKGVAALRVSVLNGEERRPEERCRLLRAHGAQRSRTPGCDAIRLAGGMHAATLVLTWPLCSLCLLPGTPSLAIPPQSAFRSKVTLSEGPPLTTLPKRALPARLSHPQHLYPGLPGFFS